MNDTPEELTTVDGTVKSIVFRNDETGYSVLRVSGGGDGMYGTRRFNKIFMDAAKAQYIHFLPFIKKLLAPSMFLRAFATRCPAMVL